MSTRIFCQVCCMAVQSTINEDFPFQDHYQVWDAHDANDVRLVIHDGECAMHYFGSTVLNEVEQCPPNIITYSRSMSKEIIMQQARYNNLIVKYFMARKRSSR